MGGNWAALPLVGGAVQYFWRVEAFAGFTEFLPESIATDAGLAGEGKEVVDAEFLAEIVEGLLQIGAGAVALRDYDYKGSIHMAEPAYELNVTLLRWNVAVHQADAERESRSVFQVRVDEVRPFVD